VTAQWAHTETQEVPYKHNKTLLFTVRVTDHCHRLPIEVEFPSVEILKSCLDMVLGNLLYMALLEQGSWTR